MPKPFDQSPTSRNCANCRYLGRRPDGSGVCANPRLIPPAGPVAPDHGCDAFQISLAAARALAFARNAAAEGDHPDAKA